MTPLYSDSPWIFDFESFRRQQSIFALLNLLLIAVLLAIHTILTDYVGIPSPISVALLAGGFILQWMELIWLRLASSSASAAAHKVMVWWPIVLNTALAAMLSIVERGFDHQYFILMVVPVLEAAFRLGLAGVITVVTIANFLNFFSAYWLESVNEYFEAGATSMIYTVVGVLVWLLVRSLREREALLKYNVDELKRTRERLTAEEKLAAVGRLSSAIAHEIRNPVAMISSSLATATRPGQDEAEQRKMFEIAAAEATRLERLTTEFLSYARPRPVRLMRTNLADTLHYVAAIASAHAGNQGVAVKVEVDTDLQGDCDAAQIQQALLNLVLNAIDACPSGGAVTLGASGNGKGATVIDVADTGAAIAPEVIAHLFEPFFTTKPGGTGLGLAIAHNIARSHRGDLSLSVNEPGQVCFTIKIPAQDAAFPAEVGAHDEQTAGGR
jgi:two-component system, NtrC family, sensor histidine kinase HydH